MNVPSNLKYTKSDEWFDPETGKMGLTDYAQDQLSDIVFVEPLVEVDDEVEVPRRSQRRPTRSCQRRSLTKVTRRRIWLDGSMLRRADAGIKVFS